MAGAGFVSALAAACSLGSGDTADGDQAGQAKAAFWDTFGAGDMDGLPAVRDRLIAQAQAHPEDAELDRLIGQAYSGQAFDTARETNPVPLSEMPSYIHDSATYLERASTASADPDTRLWNSAFYAGDVYTGGNPLAPPDPEKQAEGRNIFQDVIDKWPVYGHFNRAAQFQRLPKDTADFASAVASFFSAYDDCTGTNVDHVHPDLSGMVHGGVGTTDTNRPCGNLPHVPHNIQGEMFNFADVLVKNGQPDAARPVYEGIKQTDGYETWAYRDQVEERLASDLALRSSLYADPDRNKWPAIGASPCLSCHQR
jgi:hypothetical protein